MSKEKYPIVDEINLINELKDAEKEPEKDTKTMSDSQGWDTTYYLMAALHFGLCLWNGFMFLNHGAEVLLYDLVLAGLLIFALLVNNFKMVIRIGLDKKANYTLQYTLISLEVGLILWWLWHIIATFS